MTGTRTAALVLGASVAAALAAAAGLAGVLYAAFFTLALVPGLPLGFLVFGHRHPAGWVLGGLLGYGLTQMMLWAVIDAGQASPAAFAVGWLVLSALTWTLRAGLGRGAALDWPGWTARDTRALLLVLILVPALMAPPYANLGRADDSGARYYRAYFTADFLWHAALGSELGKFSLPPRNPYLAPSAMNYYWTYFLLPASVAAVAPVEPLRDVQTTLEANAILAGVLMMASLFLLVRTGVDRSWPAVLAVVLTALAASAEGWYEIGDLLARGRPLAQLLDTNIDAVTAWQFGGLRIDNIPRSLWYTPQHTTSIALALAALVVCAIGGAAAPALAIGIAGLALGLATTMNPLLGGAGALVYGACVAIDALRRHRGWRLLPRHALAALPVVLAVAWGAASRVTEGAGSALDFGFSAFSRNRPLLTLVLSLGPVLIPALPGAAVRRASQRPVVIGYAGIALGLFLLYFVRISEASWVGFRAGQILLVSIPILLARTLEWMGPRAAAALAVVILAIGLPTTIIDTWNAQDIGNRRQGPGFRWTLWVTPAQQEAFAWIREHTPETAIVQMEPIVRAREHWTLIPSFAGRRMAAGLPISLLPIPEYQERSARVQRIFQTGDPIEAVQIARDLRIDYLYVDPEDRGAYPEGVAKFDAHPEYFRRVFANEEVSVYQVK